MLPRDLENSEWLQDAVLTRDHKLRTSDTIHIQAMQERTNTVPNTLE